MTSVLDAQALSTIMGRRVTSVSVIDADPGNVYFRNGEAGLLDWQGFDAEWPH